MGLADTVQKVERTLDASRSVDTVINLVERVEQLIGGIEDQFPDAIFTLTAPESESFEVDTVGLITAIEEACKNAVKHNDSPDPTVDIEIERISEDWIKIEITDNGPGIPSQELDVLEKGETPLQHANRLGIWLIHWVVSKEGGEFSVVENEMEGTTVQLSVPVAGQ
jgi:signal transduction histidine kinase